MLQLKTCKGVHEMNGSEAQARTSFGLDPAERGKTDADAEWCRDGKGAREERLERASREYMEAICREPRANEIRPEYSISSRDIRSESFVGRPAIRMPRESPSKSWWKTIATTREAEDRVSSAFDLHADGDSLNSDPLVIERVKPMTSEWIMMPSWSTFDRDGQREQHRHAKKVLTSIPITCLLRPTFISAASSGSVAHSSSTLSSCICPCPCPCPLAWSSPSIPCIQRSISACAWPW